MEQFHRFVLFGLVVLALLALSVVPAAQAQAAPDQAALQPSSTPLETLLNGNGTLDLSTGFSGSLYLSGWSMTLADDGTPHFSRPGVSDHANNIPAFLPASVPDDAYWDGRFDYPPGVAGGVSMVRAVAVSGSDLYVGGSFTATGSISANNIAKWNPANGWSSLGNGVGSEVDALAVSGSNIYAGGWFNQLCGNAACQSGGTTAYGIAQWNGSTWSPVGHGVDNAVLALAVSGSNVYAGGNFTQVCGNADCNSGNTTVNRIARWNGSAWSPLGNGVNSDVYALAVSGSNVYAGGNFSQVCGNADCNSGNTTVNRIAQWNGSSWSTLGSGVAGDVHALAVSGSNVYAGGYFTQVCGNAACNSGNTTVNYIAQWNGSSWSPLANGVGYFVLALAVSGSNIYAGGWFGILCGDSTCTIGNTTAYGIAQWNGSTWSPVGNGVHASGVYALAVSGSNVYAGGAFTSIGGVTANHIAVWNGYGWSALGNGVSSDVYALAVSGSSIYAGGVFNWVCGDWTCNIGNTTVNRIAQWNGSTWSPLANGVDSSVLALAVSGSNVYAGGGFNWVCGNAACDSGNTPVNRIARWNGSAWSPLGYGVDASGVYALAVSGSNVYAGGQFSQACGNAACDSGNTPVNHIARWNGSAWSPLGHGVNGLVYALAVSGSNVYAGGLVSQVCDDPTCTIGNTTVNHIAQWNGSSWSALGSGMNSAVRALGAHGIDVYAGGLFTAAGGKPSFHFAHWSKPLGFYLPMIEK